MLDLLVWLTAASAVPDLLRLDKLCTYLFFNMKFLSLISSALVATVAAAGPVEKRAAVTDVANIGYATQNGG